jgi:hypothetical protein
MAASVLVLAHYTGVRDASQYVAGEGDFVADRLKSGLWVRAQLRICDRAGRPAAVLRHGDDDVGVIVLKLRGADDRVRLYAQTTAPDGGLAWHRPLGPEPVSEAEADAYIKRSLDFDPDLWALEILDRDGGFALDGRVID